MSKVVPKEHIQSLHGKMSMKSEIMYVTNSVTGDVHTRLIGKRNYEAHPVTEGEKRVHNKMREAVAAYKELKQHPEEYQRYMEESEKARGGRSVYHYYMQQYLNEGKNSRSLTTARSSSSVKSYVEGMKMCRNVEEADRLLVDFVEKLGYKELVAVYKEVVKWNE